MAQADEQKFESPYMFKKDNVVVVLRHSLEQNIRHKIGSPHEVDANGGFGKFAQWTTHLREKDGHIDCKFQNVHSGDYLRIADEGKKVDVAGKGGPWCWFRIHFQNVGVVKLESLQFEGKYVAVDKDGVRVGAGGPWCRLHVLKEGAPPPFSKPYVFAKNNIVVIEHRDQAHMRVKGENDHTLESTGGKGDFAQFEAMPSDNGQKVQLKSCKNGLYVRIFNGKVDCGGKGGPWTHFKVHPVDAPHHVRLESEKCPGEFITLDAANSSFKVGDGKHKASFLTFYRDN